MLVERVERSQARRDGNELAAGAALKGDKEQPRVDLTATGFDAFAVEVAQSENALLIIVLIQSCTHTKERSSGDHPLGT